MTVADIRIAVGQMKNLKGEAKRVHAQGLLAKAQDLERAWAMDPALGLTNDVRDLRMLLPKLQLAAKRRKS